MSKTYKLKYRHKMPTVCDIWSERNRAFDVCIEYKIEDLKIKNKLTTVIYIDNDYYLLSGEINPLAGLYYEDLSDEIIEQLIREKIIEMAKIEIKLKLKKLKSKIWQPWQEIAIEVDD